MAFLLPSIFPSFRNATSINKSFMHTTSVPYMDILQQNSWFLQPLILKGSHLPSTFFQIFSHSNIHLALSHLVIEVCVWPWCLERALLGNGIHNLCHAFIMSVQL